LKIDFATSLLIFYAFLIVLMAYGIFSLVLRHALENFQVDAAYIDGILTASSILFGFWTMMVQRKPKQEVEKYEATIATFFFSFGTLMLSVVLIFLTALNSCPSVVTLFFVTASFIVNATFLAFLLYELEFKKIFFP
jgi:hypothetical protein